MNDNSPERIRDDRNTDDQLRLEQRLLDGIESGSSELTERDWADIRREVRQRQADRKRKGA